MATRKGVYCRVYVHSALSEANATLKDVENEVSKIKDHDRSSVNVHTSDYMISFRTRKYTPLNIIENLAKLHPKCLFELLYLSFTDKCAGVLFRRGDMGRTEHYDINNPFFVSVGKALGLTNKKLQGVRDLNEVINSNR